MTAILALLLVGPAKLPTLAELDLRPVDACHAADGQVLDYAGWQQDHVGIPGRALTLEEEPCDTSRFWFSCSGR